MNAEKSENQNLAGKVTRALYRARMPILTVAIAYLISVSLRRG